MALFDLRTIGHGSSLEMVSGIVETPESPAARLRTLLGGEGDFPTVLRGAGMVIVIRVLASAVGYASMMFLARWMGSSEYRLYSITGAFTA